MILEGLVTTIGTAGELNIAPMGPIVDSSMSTLILRPFQTSQTFQNLTQQRCGVLHVTDDVLMLARAAIGRLSPLPETFAASHVRGEILRSACRWYEFNVERLDDSSERAQIHCRVVHVGRLRDYFGLNRAKHAVLEAAILATRLHLLSRTEVESQMVTLRPAVEKTAGEDEQAAFALLCDFVAEHYSAGSTDHRLQVS